MSTWSQFAAALNADLLTEFGEPVQYIPAGAQTGFSIIAQRNVRDREESEALAAFECLWTTQSQFLSQSQALPQQGDSVTMGGVDYVVHAVKPDPDSSSDALRIYLNRRSPLIS